MQLKSTFSIQDKKLRDLDNAKEYPTLKDLIKEQGFDNWVRETLNPVLELNGLTKNQVKIMLKVILNSREELLFQLNLGED